jgi:hypothetical protein
MEGFTWILILVIAGLIAMIVWVDNRRNVEGAKLRLTLEEVERDRDQLMAKVEGFAITRQEDQRANFQMMQTVQAQVDRGQHWASLKIRDGVWFWIQTGDPGSLNDDEAALLGVTTATAKKDDHDGQE